MLDAGSGVNSRTWIAGLQTDRCTAVTGATGHAAQIRAALRGRGRPQDRLVVGNWADPALLEGERYDTILADYLLGAVEGFAPYFQPQLFKRLAPLVGGRLYVVGLDPYVVGEPGSAAGETVQAIGRLRDACLLLAGEIPYREYPAEWVLDHLKEAGFEVFEARKFAIRYRRPWIDAQLDMCLQRLPRIADLDLAAALRARTEDLRAEAHRLYEREDGLRHGHDYVIAATLPQDAAARLLA